MPEIVKLDTGRRRYTLVDENDEIMGEICIQPSDPGLAGRWAKVCTDISEMVTAIPKTPDDILAWDSRVQEMLNEAFGSDVSSALFSRCSSLALCADGKLYLEHVLDALAPLIQYATDKAVEQQQARLQQYTAAYQADPARGLAPGQQT